MKRKIRKSVTCLSSFYVYTFFQNFPPQPPTLKNSWIRAIERLLYGNDGGVETVL